MEPLCGHCFHIESLRKHVVAARLPGRLFGAVLSKGSDIFYTRRYLGIFPGHRSLTVLDPQTKALLPVDKLGASNVRNKELICSATLAKASLSNRDMISRPHRLAYYRSPSTEDH